MTHTLIRTCLSSGEREPERRERERERGGGGGGKNSNSKTLFYKVCSLGLVKIMSVTTSPCLSYWWVNIYYRHHLRTYRHELVSKTLYNDGNFYTKHRHSVRCTHAYIILLHILSIQAATKAVEHLISSRHKSERETDRQNSNSNSKTLFYKDCSLGSVKNLSSNN